MNGAHGGVQASYEKLRSDRNKHSLICAKLPPHGLDARGRGQWMETGVKVLGEIRIYPNAGGVIDIQVNHWTVEQSGRWIMRGKIRAPIPG